MEVNVYKIRGKITVASGTCMSIHTVYALFERGVNPGIKWLLVLSAY